MAVIRSSTASPAVCCGVLVFGMASSPSQYAVEVVGDRLRGGEALVEGEAGGTHHEARRHRARLLALGQTAACQLDHLHLSRAELDHLHKALVRELAVRLEGHG